MRRGRARQRRRSTTWSEAARASRPQFVPVAKLHFSDRRHLVPSVPENFHFAGQAEGDADVFVQRGILGPDEDVALFQVLDDFVGRTLRILHPEIGWGFDGWERRAVGLVEDFLRAGA